MPQQFKDVQRRDISDGLAPTEKTLHDATKGVDGTQFDQLAADAESGQAQLMRLLGKTMIDGKAATPFNWGDVCLADEGDMVGYDHVTGEWL